MKFNNGYERRVFESQQAVLRKKYRAAGMTEEMIAAMYEFDLAVFNSDRREREHAVDPRQMMTIDPDTGDYRYMDMDELPAQGMTLHNPGRYNWLEEIKNEALLDVLCSFPTDYIEIITLLMDGYQQNEIAVCFGVVESAIANKIARMRKAMQKFHI